MKEIKILILSCMFCTIFPETVKETFLSRKDKWKPNGACSPLSWQPTSPGSKIYETCLSDDCDLIGEWDIGPANRILVEVETETRLCSRIKNIPSDQRARCKENMTLVIQSGKKKALLKEIVPKIPNSEYEKLQNDSTTISYTNRFYVDDLNDVTSIKIQFSTTGYCGYLNNVIVSYFKCPQVSGDLVDFSPSVAPNKNTSQIKIYGNCTENSIYNSGPDKPFVLCRYNGTYEVTGSCICKAGYTKKDKSCRECPDSFYKASVGNQKCSKCGNNTLVRSLVQCECISKYYREIGKEDQDQANCYRPPDAPDDITITEITGVSVTLEWTHPNPGSEKLGVYMLTCENCPKERKELPINTTSDRVTLNNLGSFATYIIKIVNVNNVTSRTGRTVSTTTKFRTLEGEPSVVRNLKAAATSDGPVVISWDSPFAEGAEQMVYVYTYGDYRGKTTRTSFTIPTDTQKKEYTVKIYAQATKEDGTIVSGPTITKVVTVSGGIALPVALGVSFGVVIFIVGLLVVAFCIWRRRNPPYLQVVRMADGTVKKTSIFGMNGKIYIDPQTYAKVDDAVNDFAYEIDAKELKLGDKIGEGEFAEVYKGILERDGKTRDVAVKRLKSNATKHDRDDFLSEAAILGQFSDPNVIYLEGVILKDDPNSIILEFMQHGALDSYLRQNDMQFSILQLLEMARGIASGMKYLSEMGFVHRDLAARNVLVNEQRVCKVADFGMSLELNVDESVETKGGKIPVRWTAPEAIQFKKFTTASDVWSYGVVLWEIMSYGERPYWDWSNFEVVEQVSRGYRLPPPMNCPRVVHDLMSQCWSKDRTRRPLFSTIRDKIETWLRNSQLLEDLAPVMKLDDNLDYTIMQTINKWLEAIGMGRYAKDFLEQGFATPRQILLLSMNDLEVLGVGPLEHRKKIYKAIENTRAQRLALIENRSGFTGDRNWVYRSDEWLNE